MKADSRNFFEISRLDHQHKDHVVSQKNLRSRHYVVFFHWKRKIGMDS